MSLKSLNDILGELEKQPGWQEQPFQCLLKYWPEAVGAVVTAHTRPVAIQRGILSVATSSAAWAQNLTFERQRILEKLNVNLPSPLTDIRFSTAQWQRLKDSSLTDKKQALTKSLWQEHPSCLVDVPRLPKSGKTSHVINPNAAFENWAQLIQARSHGLPLCPQCHCPTPLGELQRWAVCSICAAKQC